MKRLVYSIILALLVATGVASISYATMYQNADAAYKYSTGGYVLVSSRAQVWVYLGGTQTLATLYTDSTGSTTSTNPVTADNYGNYSYYAAAGFYDETIVGPAGTTPVNRYGVAVGPTSNTVVMGVEHNANGTHSNITASTISVGTSTLGTTSISQLGLAVFTSRATGKSLKVAHDAAVAAGPGAVVIIDDPATQLSSSGTLTTSVPFIYQGGKLVRTASDKIHFGAALTAPSNVQLFSGSGDWVTFGSGSVEKVSAGWFPSGTGQIQQAINAASWGVNRTYIPNGNYTSGQLYASYDSSLNPNFNPDPYYGGIEIFGDYVMGEAQYDVSKPLGTVITFNNSTGPCFTKDKDATFSGYEATNFSLHNLGFVGNNSDLVLNLKWIHSHSYINDLFVKQLNPAGGLVEIQETYMVTGTRIMLQGPSSSSLAQTGLKIYNHSTGGGLYNFSMVTVRNAVIGFDVGGHTYADGIANIIANFTLLDSQAGDCTTGAYLGWNVQSATLDNLYTESSGTVTNSIVVDQQAQNVEIKGGWFKAKTSGAQIYGGKVVNLSIHDNYIGVPDSSLSSGVTLSSAGSDYYSVGPNLFWPLVSPCTACTGIDLEGTHTGSTKLNAGGIPTFIGMTTNVKNPQYANPTIQNVTVGASPYTYTNNFTTPVLISVASGTVSSINFSRRGTSISTGQTSGMFTIDPADSLITTYTTTPTMKYILRSY